MWPIQSSRNDGTYVTDHPGVYVDLGSWCRSWGDLFDSWLVSENWLLEHKTFWVVCLSSIFSFMQITYCGEGGCTFWRHLSSLWGTELLLTAFMVWDCGESSAQFHQAPGSQGHVICSLRLLSTATLLLTFTNNAFLFCLFTYSVLG